MQASIEAGCIWYLLSSDSPSHTFIRAARCYNITPIWPGSNRRPYRPAWEPQTVQRFKFWASLRRAPPRAPWPASRNPRPPEGVGCAGRRLRISRTLAEKFCVPCRLGGARGGQGRPPSVGSDQPVCPHCRNRPHHAGDPRFILL